MAQTLTVALVIAADLEGTGRATPGAYLFAVGFGALASMGRRAPRLVLAVTVFCVFAYYALGYPPIGIALPAVAVLYRAADVGALRWAVGAGTVVVAVAAGARVAEGLPPTCLLSYELLTSVARAAAAIARGVSVRARREARLSQQRLRGLAAADQAREVEGRLQAE